jgi:hypothetical protein
MELNWGGVSQDKTPDGMCARFIACCNIPRTYEARREECDKLINLLMEEYDLSENDACDLARTRMHEAGWNFGEKQQMRKEKQLEKKYGIGGF